ncbi:MAG: hypothetical protein PVH61_32380 [Candidatus Aminicenantes bacterium]|jgi:hypothetical protein
MKKKNDTISKALTEVWKWKEEVYQDIKDKSFNEKREYFREGLEEAIKVTVGKLNKNDDGSYSII